ncbi:hypothetical protein [Bacillus sp. FJAT-28004]|uniref:hypothetical protein n=1 Tax=Bacillus sp. FJAT-28004 TaxID=1679165 RepID=UPI0006B5529D|nr:hypothetical protein [Bacillus sp. FJAT-28004]
MQIVVIRVNSQIEILKEVLREVSAYPLWKTLYGDEWLTRINELRTSIENINSKNEKDMELGIHFSFSAAQLLKRMLVYYLKHNRQDSDTNKLDMIADFILTIEDRIESSLAQLFVAFDSQVSAHKRNIEKEVIL